MQKLQKFTTFKAIQEMGDPSKYIQEEEREDKKRASIYNDPVSISS